MPPGGKPAASAAGGGGGFDEEQIVMLESMGFSRDHAKHALKETVCWRADNAALLRHLRSARRDCC